MLFWLSRLRRNRLFFHRWRLIFALEKDGDFTPHQNDHSTAPNNSVISRVARSKKLNRPNLAISSFKKGQILKNEKKAKLPSKKLLK